MIQQIQRGRIRRKNEQDCMIDNKLGLHPFPVNHLIKWHMNNEYTPMRQPCCIPVRLMDVQRKLKKEQEILKCAPSE